LGEARGFVSGAGLAFPAVVDVSSLKLGKRLGVVEDPRTLMAGDVLRAEDVRVPETHAVGGHLERVPMFLNDRLGSCTQASKGHGVITFERSSSQRGELQLTDADIEAAYSRVGGYVPGRPETDNGAYELDSLKDWRKNGLGRERDGTPHTIYAFVRVDHTDHQEVRLAHYVFGGLKVCAALPLSAADQIRAGALWDVTSGYRAEAGSWGGHSMYSFAYNRASAAVWTWGEPQWMTWAWWDAYVDEVYAVISEDYVRRGGKTPQGFDVDALNRMLARL
jgi:hypothetical protein